MKGKWRRCYGQPAFLFRLIKTGRIESSVGKNVHGTRRGPYSFSLLYSLMPHRKRARSASWLDHNGEGSKTNDEQPVMDTL